MKRIYHIAYRFLIVNILIGIPGYLAAQYNDYSQTDQGRIYLSGGTSLSSYSSVTIYDDNSTNSYYSLSMDVTGGFFVTKGLMLGMGIGSYVSKSENADDADYSIGLDLLGRLYIYQGLFGEGSVGIRRYSVFFRR